MPGRMCDILRLKCGHTNCRCSKLEEYYELDNKIPIMFIDNSAGVNFHYGLART